MQVLSHKQLEITRYVLSTVYALKKDELVKAIMKSDEMYEEVMAFLNSVTEEDE